MTTTGCSKIKMDGKLSINIELLRKHELKSCLSVLHSIVDSICLKSQPSYSDYAKVWSLPEWWDVLEACTNVFKGAVKDSWDKDKLFQELGDLSEEYKQMVLDVINSRRNDLRQQLLTDSHVISQAVLSDFDWKVKLVMSSDKLSTVQEPVVSLDMFVGGNSGKDLVSLELNKEELKNLINSLEAANKVLVQLKS